MSERASQRTVRVELLDPNGEFLGAGMAMLWRTGPGWGGEAFQLTRLGARHMTDGPAQLSLPSEGTFAVLVESVEEHSSGGERTFRLRFHGVEEGRRPEALA
ncbi:MAG: hypothetical protein WEB13_05875 [Dehalococcoidia bacterium]